jgi:hypothetical protein
MGDDLLYPAIYMRNSIETSENGDLCYNISYPKAKKGTEAMVKPRKGPPTFFPFSRRHISKKKNHKICLSMYMGD